MCCLARKKILFICFWTIFANLFCGYLSDCLATDVRTIRFAASEGSPPTSYVAEGEPAGVVIDLLHAVFELIPHLDLHVTSFPWSRAQMMVEEGEMDAFCTYPSSKRKKYAKFTPTPLYFWDYGYLIYNQKNPAAEIISGAKSFEDLEGLVFLSQSNVAWEEDNVPKSIKRYYVDNLEKMIHMTLGRDVGDFFIMPPEQAMYYKKKLGYDNTQFGITKVDFIPNSKIPFHIGLNKKYREISEEIEVIESVLQSSDFEAANAKILKRYRDEGFSIR